MSSNFISSFILYVISFLFGEMCFVFYFGRIVTIYIHGIIGFFFFSLSKNFQLGFIFKELSSFLCSGSPMGQLKKAQGGGLGRSGTGEATDISARAPFGLSWGRGLGSPTSCAEHWHFLAHLLPS